MLCIAKHMPILRIRHQNTAIWNGMCVFQFSLCIIKRLSVASFTVHFFERLNDKKIFAHTFEWWLRTNVSILPNFNRPTQTYNLAYEFLVLWIFLITLLKINRQTCAIFFLQRRTRQLINKVSKKRSPFIKADQVKLHSAVQYTILSLTNNSP